MIFFISLSMSRYGPRTAVKCRGWLGAPMLIAVDIRRLGEKADGAIGLIWQHLNVLVIVSFECTNAGIGVFASVVSISFLLQANR